MAQRVLGAAERLRHLTNHWRHESDTTPDASTDSQAPPASRPAVPPARSGGRVLRRDRIRIAVGRLARRPGRSVIPGGTEETDVLHGTVTSLNCQGDVAPDADFNPLRDARGMTGAPLARVS